MRERYSLCDTNDGDALTADPAHRRCKTKDGRKKSRLHLDDNEGRWESERRESERREEERRESERREHERRENERRQNERREHETGERETANMIGEDVRSQC